MQLYPFFLQYLMFIKMHAVMESSPLCLHLHTSRYSIIVPLHYRLIKVSTKRWLIPQASDVTKYRVMILISHCVNKTCSLKQKVKIKYPQNSDEKVILIGRQTITNLRPEHLQARLLKATFVKDDLCQVWLKLAQWFWRRFFFLNCQFIFTIS